MRRPVHRAPPGSSICFQLFFAFKCVLSHHICFQIYADLFIEPPALAFAFNFLLLSNVCFRIIFSCKCLLSNNICFQIYAGLFIEPPALAFACILVFALQYLRANNIACQILADRFIESVHQPVHQSPLRHSNFLSQHTQAPSGGATQGENRRRCRQVLGCPRTRAFETSALSGLLLQLE
jgi:hypothetical protein